MPTRLKLGTATRVLLLLAVTLGVCFGQVADDHSAKLIVQYGRVSALLDSGQRALFVGDSIKPQQLIVTGPDGYAQFQVADGSTFEVFASSKVLFREHIGNFTDLLNVIIGHVKVYIQHLNGQPNPNNVNSPTAVISVRGTVFEVVVEDDEGTTYVSVDEGLVSVRNHTAPGDAVYLQPGESVRVFRNQPLAVRTIDKGSIFRAILRAAEEAVYQIVLRPSSGGLGGGRTTIPTVGTASGDTGKGGTTTTAPGAPSAPSAPSAPGAPGAP